MINDNWGTPMHQIEVDNGLLKAENERLHARIVELETERSDNLRDYAKLVGRNNKAEGRIAELEAAQAEHDRELDLQCKATANIATEAALRFAWSGTVHGSELDAYVRRGLKALLGEDGK